MPLLKTPPDFLQFLYIVVYPESDFFVIAEESKGKSAITKATKAPIKARGTARRKFSVLKMEIIDKYTNEGESRLQAW